ncbi:putative quinol monooxygenase [Halorubrum sp. CBA1229]|uniref:putative quinol monooxygenase n=1 Tax=Halorubrum sp. CBA1229 TaxID=1853699 RepID=UPI000F406ED6|nr:putative quinol monooxygenase [Halorubrum sp. CBA1229]QKY17671.1 antibiotic biosynthesis monooxygenase [Halorubrum sp. CBA1229]
MIVLHAVFPLDPDKRDEALDLIAELAEKSRAEPGMIEYRPTTDVDDPNVVRFFERYEDEAAFEAHSKTDHFQAFEAALPDLLAGEPEVTRFEIESADELEL